MLQYVWSRQLEQAGSLNKQRLLCFLLSLTAAVSSIRRRSWDSVRTDGGNLFRPTVVDLPGRQGELTAAFGSLPRMSSIKCI